MRRQTRTTRMRSTTITSNTAGTKQPAAAPRPQLGVPPLSCRTRQLFLPNSRARHCSFALFALSQPFSSTSHTHLCVQTPQRMRSHIRASCARDCVLGCGSQAAVFARRTIAKFRSQRVCGCEQAGLTHCKDESRMGMHICLLHSSRLAAHQQLHAHRLTTSGSFIVARRERSDGRMCRWCRSSARRQETPNQGTESVKQRQSGGRE